MFRPRFRRNESAWRKVIDVIRRAGVQEVAASIDNDPDAEWSLKLTKRKVDAQGNVISETYSKQNSGDTPTDGMQLHRLSKSPNGGEWKIYTRNPDMKIAYNALVQELAQQARPFPPTVIPDTMRAGYCLMPMLADHHFGKIAFGYKGESWSLDEAREVWNDAINHYLYEARGLPIAQILLPIGNDLLHTNSDTNTTKRGTPMEVSESFGNLYKYVRDVVVSSINRLAEIAPVQVVMVPGNHDEDAILRLGDYLEGLYSEHPVVKINNKQYRRKYFQFGSTGIGFAHGEKVKPRDLHGAFSNDVPKMFSDVQFRYFFVGHLHKNATRKLSIYDERKDEYMGTQVEICPSLCPTDKWHFDNNYTGNQRSSKCYLFDAEQGRVAEWYFNLQPKKM